MYLEHVLGQCETTRLPSNRRAAVKAQDAFRIAGIIWSNDPAGVRAFRQTDEYDSYALKIVEFNPLTLTDLKKILSSLFIYSEPLCEALQIYLAI